MTTARSNAQNEDLARWIWTLVIVGFFALQAVLWFVAITLTARDPSFAVAPRYEQESESWDAIAARRQASQALGWTLEFELGAARPDGTAELQIVLLDRAGQGIDDAQFELAMFHCARAAERQQPIVRALGAGRYGAELQMARDGVWKLNGVARRGAEEYHFDVKQRFDVDGGKK
jgi:nitrogen fixation protein FixH